jgi:POT family proton-dependent oligopeptide transporter
LALFGRLAPEGFRATSIATWFFAGFFGNLLAGGLGTLWSVLGHGLFFVMIGGVSGVSGLLLYLLSRRLGDVERHATAAATTLFAH